MGAARRRRRAHWGRWWASVPVDALTVVGSAPGHGTSLSLNDVEYVDARVFEPSDLRRREFEAATPFPHLVVDDVLKDEARSLLDVFPSEDWDGWHRYGDEYQRNKLICSDIDRIPAPFDQLIRELNDPTFLARLEQLTGIANLIPDPYLEGGGLHCSGPGGVLAPHTDFHVYTRLNLYRRINVLVYLNPEWDHADGGQLELFAVGADSPSERIEPTWGRMVVFLTDDRSPHGFTTPVAPGKFRRSVALYYYTSTETEGFSGDTNTYWKQHGDQRGVRRWRLVLYKLLLTASRAFSFLAHRVNPNLGSRVRPK